MVFGSKAAPAKFHDLPETLVNIACSESNFPHDWVHRQLDDIPALASSGLVENFAQSYINVCQQVGVPLAELCEKRKKTFGPGTVGVVLGIWFDSEKQMWSLPSEKAESVREIIQLFKEKTTCNLKEAQILQGKLTSVAKMSDYAMGYRYHLAKLLGSFGADDEGSRIVTAKLKQDLTFWETLVEAAERGLPLCEPPRGAPLTAVEFISDAAGAAYSVWNGGRVNASKSGDRGVASISTHGDRCSSAQSTVGRPTCL